MLYVESSALFKRYIAEPDSGSAILLMESEATLSTSRLTVVEVRRNLARLLDGAALVQKRQDLLTDLESFHIAALDDTTFEDAARIAEETLCRSLDAIHLAAARRASPNATVLTFDRRQAQAARAIGIDVLGT